MPSAERFVYMTGLLLALFGGLALCGVSSDTVRVGVAGRDSMVRYAS